MVRKSVAETAPRSWKVGADWLEIVQQGQTYTIPLAKLSEVRLRYEPGRFATNRCTVDIITNTGWTAQIDNQHWADVADFEDRSFSYRLLVEALLARLARANPSARLVTGQGAMLWASMAFVLLMVAVLFFVVLAIGGPIVAMLKLVVLLFFVPTMVRYVRANRRRIQPISDAPPDGVLPRIQSVTTSASQSPN